MGYNRRYYLKQVIKVQAIIKQMEKLGIPYTRIYKDYIEDQFDISYSTYTNYLTVSDPEDQLKELEENIYKQKQLKIKKDAK
ncbi:MAG: hypothetical protein JW857_11900 [Bacteroidales bacterium]|nr:hypothetical protein [Bacteroidales bacterium]MBN2747179.1 hypothetical protein [Bacteroidales bacterium]